MTKSQQFTVKTMAFGIMIVGMAMGLMAALAAMPSDAGLLMAAATYIGVGCLTFMTVIAFAMLGDSTDDEDLHSALTSGD